MSHALLPGRCILVCLSFPMGHLINRPPMALQVVQGTQPKVQGGTTAEENCWMAGTAVCPGTQLHIIVHSASLIIAEMELLAVQDRRAGVFCSGSKHVQRASHSQECQKRLDSSGSRNQRLHTCWLLLLNPSPRRRGTLSQESTQMSGRTAKRRRAEGWGGFCIHVNVCAS